MKKNDLSPEAFRFEGKMSLKQALPLGMQLSLIHISEPTRP